MTQTYIQRFGNKYNARRTGYHGTSYMSNKEAEYARELDMRKDGGDIKNWEKQVKLSLDVNGVHIANYFMDFVIEHNDGSFEAVEVKGFETEVWKVKWKLAMAIYGEKYTFTLIK